MVIAAGSVINDPRTGLTVSKVNHQAELPPPPKRAVHPRTRSANSKIGRVEAIVIMTTTKTASV